MGEAPPQLDPLAASKFDKLVLGHQQLVTRPARCIEIRQTRGRGAQEFESQMGVPGEALLGGGA
jgi:hypothetical protein